MSRLRRIAAFTALMLLTACYGFGTPGYDVLVTNEAEVQVRYFAHGVGRDPDATSPGVSLLPGRSHPDHWQYPTGFGSSRVATIRAFDESGTMVFCQVLSYSDLQRMKFLVDIHTGILDCGL